MRVYEVPDEQRYWVIRASGGAYVEHFLKGGIAAIGHLDVLGLPETKGEAFNPDHEELANAIEKTMLSKEKAPASITSTINQVAAFIGEIQIGDLIIAPSSYQLLIGRVVGHPEIDRTPVKVVHDPRTGRGVTMSHNLRRKVEWGPRIQRRTIPYQLENSLRAHQTVFSFDKHWDLLHHMLYPVFVYDGELYFTLRITKADQINSHTIGNLFALLTDLEVISKTASKGLLASDATLPKLYSQFKEVGTFGLTTKAEFASPGTIWGKIGLTDTQGKALLYFLVGYAALFGAGGDYIGTEGLVTAKMREMILERLMESEGKHDAAETKKDLGIKLPSHDTKKLEDPAMDAVPITLMQAKS